MPQVIVTEVAAEGLERCRKFLATKAPDAAKRAAEAISRQLSLLESAPEIGRTLTDIPDLRELIIAFGDSGYVALYRYDPPTGVVYVLVFRHQREAGY